MTLIIHIGTPKTGSSLIQKSLLLASENKYLEENNLHYINNQLCNNDILFFLANKDSIYPREYRQKWSFKKESYINEFIYSFIELYFRNNISINNINILNLYNYFIKKINDTKIYNLDEETLFMEFENRILNG